MKCLTFRAIVDDNEFGPPEYPMEYKLPSRASDAGPEPRAFFAPQSEPCESCGEPCGERTWNAEHELWIGVDCSCSIPDQKMPDCLYEVVMQAETAGELVRMAKAHRATCATCAGRKAPGRETRGRKRRAA